MICNKKSKTQAIKKKLEIKSLEMKSSFLCSEADRDVLFDYYFNHI